MTKKHFTYKCPACKKKQDAADQAQEGVLYYRFDFETQNWEAKDHDGKDVIGWYCPNCRNELPDAIVDDIEQEINK